MISMTYRRTTLAVALCLFVRDLCALDERRIAFRQSTDGSLSPEGQPDALFKASERELREGAFDPAAGALLAAAVTFTKSIFNVPSLHFQRAVTRRDAGDIVVAQWNIDEPYAKGSIILVDTPVVSLYELHLAGVSLNSRDDLATFLSKLLIWGKPPLDAQSVTLGLPAGVEGIREFSGKFATPPVSTPVIRDVYISGIADGNESFMTVQVGKGFTRSAYPVPPFIPERFPPLTELAHSWTFARLWGEVGKTFDLRIHMDFSEHRDEILIKELIRRRLSEDQFLDLLSNTKPGYMESRAGIVFSALASTGKEASLNRYFESALNMYERIGPVAGSAAELVFRFASRSCSPALEAHAVRLMKSGVFQKGALSYIGACSSSSEMLRAVEAVSVPDSLVQQKETVLRGIRRRLDNSQR